MLSLTDLVFTITPPCTHAQESVDICDFAVGLSRALNGSIIPSERSVPASAFECIMHSPPAGLLLLFPLTTKHTLTYDPQNKTAPGTS